MKVELKESPVVFSERPHGYTLGGRRLSGVTSLIHQVLGLGVYPDASDFVRDVAIPRAGEYGSAVHRAIEVYDKLGVKVTAHPKSERFRQGPDDDVWVVEDELESYIRHRAGYEPVANEYTVSDGENYASNIDNVWLKTDTGGLWLVDTKTNNLGYYPGGEDGLKEYLSWQLSVYAFMFELQNPGIKVEGLACNWLRRGDAAFWVIERKSDEDVAMLLSVPWEYADGHFVYRGEQVARALVAELSAAVSEEMGEPVVPEDMAMMIYRLARQAEETKRALDEMKARLREAMESRGVKTWDSGMFRATIAKDSETEAFDTARFRREQPEMYAQYTKRAAKKGGFTIKLHD